MRRKAYSPPTAKLIQHRANTRHSIGGILNETTLPTMQVADVLLKTRFNDFHLPIMRKRVGPYRNFSDGSKRQLKIALDNSANGL